MELGLAIQQDQNSLKTCRITSQNPDKRHPTFQTCPDCPTRSTSIPQGPRSAPPPPAWKGSEESMGLIYCIFNIIQRSLCKYYVSYIYILYTYTLYIVCIHCVYSIYICTYLCITFFVRVESEIQAAKTLEPSFSALSCLQYWYTVLITSNPQPNGTDSPTQLR